MNRSLKLGLSFLPLGLLGAGALMLIVDLKAPVQHVIHRCDVVAQGQQAGPYRKKHRVIYDQGSTPQHDLALSCPRLGTVVLNDPDLARVTLTGVGAPVRLQMRRYRFLPTIWRALVPTVSGDKQPR